FFSFFAPLPPSLLSGPEMWDAILSVEKWIMSAMEAKTHKMRKLKTWRPQPEPIYSDSSSEGESDSSSSGDSSADSSSEDDDEEDEEEEDEDEDGAAEESDGGGDGGEEHRKKGKREGEEKATD